MSAVPEPTPHAPVVDETTRELRRLGIAAATFLALAALAYAVPSLGRFRLWVPGEATPLASLFASWDHVAEAPAIAGGGYASAGALAPAPRAPGAGPASPASHHGLAIDPGEYAGVEIPIERPEALDAFYGALAETARGARGAITRIAHYGDSTIATDLVTHTLRRQLQLRYGDGGHGFLLMARGTMPYRHRDVVHRASTAWELRELVMNQDPTGGIYGYGGVHYRALPGAVARFGTAEDAPVGTRASRFSVHFRRQARAGTIRVRIDDAETRTIGTQGEGDAVETLAVADGPHTFEVRPSPGARLFGVSLERDGPGVVYDSLGMVGARARRLLNFDPAHVAGQIRARDPDLLVLGFGGNEADDPLRDARIYEDEFVAVLERMRAGKPDMSCLVFAPLDQAQRDERGNIRTLEPIPMIVGAQARAARRVGCAFYNTFEAMGGEGAMGKWWRARPRRALSDFRHATPEGYELIASQFYKALLKGFAEYLRRQPAS